MTAKVSKKNSFSTLSYQVLWLGSGIRPPRTIPLGPYIVETFNKWIRLLLPKNHTLRQKAHQCFVQSIKLFNEQKAFVKKHYEYFLLVSEKYFADFYNIREERRSLILPCLEHGSASQNMVHRRYMKNGMSNGMVFLLPVIKTAQAFLVVPPKRTWL